jgi:hypothetical protein
MTFGGVVEEFKRIGSLVWRGLFVALNVYFFVTRFADLVAPDNRASWSSFGVSSSVPYWQILSSQALTVLLTGILVYCCVDRYRYEKMHDRIEFIGVQFASSNLTYWMYAYKYRVETGVPVARIAQKMNTQFGLSLIMLAFCIILAVGIEVIFREKSERRTT